MGGRTNVDTDNSYTVIDLTGLSDDLQLAAVYAATGVRYRDLPLSPPKVLAGLDDEPAA